MKEVATEEAATKEVTAQEAATKEVGTENYLLGAGDVLTVGVWGLEDLQVKELVVRPDGNIAFPLVGEVQAAGVSTAELTGILTTGLSEYVKNPKVTVNVVKFHTTRVYVLGMVAKPGMYELEKQHNLLDAIGAAGSYTKEAAKKRVTIIRKDQAGAPIKVNLMNIWEKGDMTQNYALGDGDVVYLADNGQINIPGILATVYQLKTTITN
ncbi:MAG: polysaccharide biosynthesis/export family protein [Sporomusaceae bacterium]|nr:polysaccharide biosynthesis/export family protein [Sporomusaceae bacterium]